MPAEKITLTELEYLRLWKKSVQLAEEAEIERDGHPIGIPMGPRLAYLGELIQDCFRDKFLDAYNLDEDPPREIQSHENIHD